jgi:hypothetical protein
MRKKANWLLLLCFAWFMELSAQYTPPPLTKTGEGIGSLLISPSEQIGRYPSQGLLVPQGLHFDLYRVENELLPQPKNNQKYQLAAYYPNPFTVLGSGVSANWFEKILYPYGNRSMATQLWGLSRPGRNFFAVQPGTPYALIPALLSPLLKPVRADGKSQTFGDLNRQSKAWRPRDMERY